MDTIYKTLVEILLLHEFYLTESEGNTIFDKAQQADKINYLVNNYDDSDSQITDDLLFEPTGISKKNLKNQHARIISTYSGFKIVFEVNEKKLNDGTIVYQPKINLPVDWNINIQLVKNDRLLDGFTNSRLQRSIPAIYYFSNEDVAGQKTAPSLSNAVPVFDASFPYEMGELAFKDNLVKQFINDGSTDPWIAVTDNGYINETDRLLVPFRFNFSFNESDNVTQASFTLKDKTGAIFKTIELSGDRAIQQASLDWRKTGPDLELILPTTIADVSTPAFYTMEVSGNNNYAKKFQVLFFDDETKLKSCWAVLNIKSRVGTAALNLIDDDGYLFTRVNAAGIVVEAPVFEIRIKSRLAYWWYLSNNSSYKLKTTTTTQSFVTNDNGVLKTIKPRATTYSPTLFTSDGSNFQNLPNPQPTALLLNDSGKFYKNILVAQSDMFPVEPANP